MATRLRSRRVLIVGVLCLTLSAAGCKGLSWDSWKTSSLSPKFLKAKKLKDPVGVHLAQAQWMESRGDLTEARESYQFVLSEDPASADAILGIARLDHLAERHDEAEAGFLKALELRPNDPVVQHAVGQYYTARKNWPEAIRHLRNAQLAMPNEESYRFHLAVALAQSGDTTAAMPYFERSVGKAEAHYNIGYILHEQGKTSAAERQFTMALETNPKLAQAQKMLDDIARGRGAAARDSRQYARTHAASPQAGAMAANAPTGSNGGVQHVGFTANGGTTPAVNAAHTVSSSQQGVLPAVGTAAQPAAKPTVARPASNPNEPAPWSASPQYNASAQAPVSTPKPSTELPTWPGAGHSTAK